MRPSEVVLLEPVVDDDLGLLRGREPLGIENLPAQCPVEAFIVAVLPWRSGIDADRFDANASREALSARACQALSMKRWSQS